MKYRYQGYDRTAKKVSGELEASSDSDARNKLRAQSVRPLTLVPADQPRFKFSIPGMGGGAPDTMEFTAFIRQFAVMQAAGISIVQALKVLAEQTPNRAFGDTLGKLQKNIEEGATFTDALRKHPKVFDRIFINLVAAGEVSGSLDKVLQRLATYYEKAASLRRKVKGAMTYPVMVVVLVIVIVGVMLTFVVPTFAGMFKDNGKELPAATQMLLNISDVVRGYWYLILGSLVGTFYGIMMLFKTESTRRVIDPYLMKAPLFGDLIQKIGIARFSRTFGTMIQSGVPILEALEITGRIAGNYAIEDAVAKTRESITQGNSIAGPLMATDVFPRMAVSMIAIGEQTGALDQMLTKIAEFYEDEVDAKVSAMTSILEPLMIVIVGSVVAGVMIPMYLPIFKMAETMGN